MIVSYSICRRDEAIALSTLEWAFSLDGKLPYHAILSLGDGVEAEPLREAMVKLFSKVTVIGSNAPESWPQGKNAAFQNLVRYLNDVRNQESFLWWETDAIPLKKGWLATLESEHLVGGKAFTGYVHDALKCMECVGIYPPNFMEYSPVNGMLCRAAPWDRCCGAEIIQNVHRANHLMQFVHDVDGFPPTFPKDAKLLKDGAVLFHACKDGTLIEELSKGAIKRFIGNLFKKPEAKKSEPITVVFAVCAKDVEQAIEHARWLAKITPVKWPHKAVLAHDFDVPHAKSQELKGLLYGFFESFSTFIYPTPTDKTYPAVANFAFARVAEMMAHRSAPWFWLEADAVVLKANWLEELQKEYEAAGKPFMGPIVKENGFWHPNGSCVYPADTVRRIPNALRQTKYGWDYSMREEVNGDCHDASRLIFHLWGLVNGQPSATNGTQPPRNFTPEMARNILPPGAVLVHRVKDNSLVDLLMKGELK